jgi:hypothetical protein
MDGQTDGPTDGQTDRQMTERQTDDRQTDKALNSSRFLEISRTNFREQVSRLEIRELNLMLPVPVPENGNGKIKKLSRRLLIVIIWFILSLYLGPKVIT